VTGGAPATRTRPSRRASSRVHRVGLAVAALLLLATACGGGGGGGAAAAGQDRVVRIAAAADLRFALDELEPLVRATHPEVRLAITYGSSGQFAQQLEQGAPFDLYLSADLALAERLVERDLAAEEDLFAYAVGRLVLWTPEGSAVDPAPGLTVLADPRVRRVAIANPEHAPYGRAAEAAIRAAGVEDDVRPKLLLGENVAQAAEFVQSGGADAGVVAMSLVLSDPLRDAGRWAEVPLESFPRLLQGGVVLARAEDVEAARAVRDALLSGPGRDLLRRYGFFLPDDEG
jgi:molybdate transport system substrate-binding protein